MYLPHNIANMQHIAIEMGRANGGLGHFCLVPMDITEILVISTNSLILCSVYLYLEPMSPYYSYFLLCISYNTYVLVADYVV